MYLVKWRDYTNDDCTWKPRKELFKNPMLKGMIDKFELVKV